MPFVRSFARHRSPTRCDVLKLMSRHSFYGLKAKSLMQKISRHFTLHGGDDDDYDDDDDDGKVDSIAVCSRSFISSFVSSFVRSFVRSFVCQTCQ